MSTRLRRPHAEDGLFILGLIGRAGSGKTTVARALESDGAVVLEADRLGHEVTDTDPEVREALAAEYGPDIYRGDGTLDRRRVAARVFTDPVARKQLDRLVHPRIIHKVADRIEELRARGFTGVVVIDAALMLQWRLERACDALMAVTAPEPEQVARLMRSRGWTEEEARLRLAAQGDEPRLLAAADEVLDNRGSLAELETRAREALARMKAARGVQSPPASGGLRC